LRSGLLRRRLLSPGGLALLGLLGALGAFRVAIAAALGLGRSRDGKRRNSGDQECPGHG